MLSIWFRKMGDPAVPTPKKISLAIGLSVAMPIVQVAYVLDPKDWAMDLVCVDEVIERTPSPGGAAEALVLDRDCRGGVSGPLRRPGDGTGRAP